MIIALIVAIVFLIIGCSLDTYITDKGIRKGVAVEGNTMIQHFFGFKPSLRQLIMFWVSFYSPFIIASLVFNRITQLAVLFISMFSVMAVKHTKEYFNWRKYGA